MTRPMILRCLSRATMALAALFVLAPAAPALAGDGPEGVCRTDRYFVHVPTFADAAVVPPRFGRQVRRAMQQHIPADRFGPRFAIESVQRVLPARRVDQRADGARRFWQVRLDRELTPGEACAFMADLRTEVYDLLADPRIYIGRECTATGTGDPVDALAPDWHFELMGRPAPLADDQTPAPVAVIDTGFAAPADYVADPDFELDLHRHGTAMADLVSQVEPAIPLLDYRALDANGMGDLADVARAIDAAVFEAEGPQVLNLSLGWPPELERARTFEGGNCSTTEDPAGEAVRYALAMARLRDADLLTVGGGVRPANGPTAVVAAAGNRPSPFGGDPSFFIEKLLDVDDQAPNLDPCSAPTDDDLHYPAQWSRRDTCLTVAGIDYSFNRLTIAVGATDHRDLAASTTPLVTPPAVVAPGAFVRAAGVRWSGSSVSAALMSGAVSLAFAEGAASSDEAFDTVWSAAHPVSFIGVQSRRLAFSEPHVAAPPAPVGDYGQLVDGSLAEPWSNFELAVCLLILVEWSLDDADFQAVQANCPPFLHTLDQFTAGRAGPQPHDPGCPDCLARLFPNQNETVDLDIALNDTWDPATTIEEPFLYAKWPDGAYIWLPLPDDGQTWTPGAQFTVKGLKVQHPDGTLSLADLEAGGTMELRLEVQTPKQNEPTSDVSDLLMKLY